MDVIGAVPFMPPGRPSVAEQAQLIDSFRKLRLALRAYFISGEPITLAVTSKRPREGKTFVAANLSLNFAEAGFKTLFVDGDHRDFGAAPMFGVPTVPGLRDLEHGDATSEVAVHPTSYERCYVLPYGSARPSIVPPESASFLNDLRARFDVIVVDAPLWGSDSHVDALVSRTGGYIVVQRLSDYRKSDRRPESERIDNIPVRALGVVSIGAERRGR